MGKRIVIALGGNALGNNLPEQMIAVKKTASAIVDLIEAGNEVVIAHGNGPQVGMIQNAMSELTRSNPEKYIPCPLSVYSDTNVCMFSNESGLHRIRSAECAA